MARSELTHVQAKHDGCDQWFCTVIMQTARKTRTPSLRFLCSNHAENTQQTISSPLLLSPFLFLCVSFFLPQAQIAAATNLPAHLQHLKNGYPPTLVSAAGTSTLADANIVSGDSLQLERHLSVGEMTWDVVSVLEAFLGIKFTPGQVLASEGHPIALRASNLCSTTGHDLIKVKHTAFTAKGPIKKLLVVNKKDCKIATQDVTNPEAGLVYYRLAPQRTKATVRIDDIPFTASKAPPTTAPVVPAAPITAPVVPAAPAATMPGQCGPCWVCDESATIKLPCGHWLCTCCLSIYHDAAP